MEIMTKLNQITISCNVLFNFENIFRTFIFGSGMNLFDYTNDDIFKIPLNLFTELYNTY